MVWIEPLFSTANLMLFYYPLMYFTWAVLVKRKRIFAGVVVLVLQIILYTIIYEILERQMIAHCSTCLEILAEIPERFKTGMDQLLIPGILSTLLSGGVVYILIAKLSPVIALKIALDYTHERTTALELEKENIQLEFNLLKSQVNPHFLFNTLNNIHSLIVQQRNPQASATVAKLSGFLRHSLYESGGEWVQLSRELAVLIDYIELEKLRLNKTQVTVQVDAGEENPPIPALLFLSLAENAFKYSADHLPGKSYIDIRLLGVGKQVEFYCRNDYDPQKRTTTGGIGMAGLRKRLQHYYPGKHEIQIKDEHNIYEITISIAV